MEDVRRTLSVLEAYASILPMVAGAISYLMYITAALLGFASTMILIELLGVQGTSLWIVYGLSFTIIFAIVTVGIYKLWKVLAVLEAFRMRYGVKYSRYYLLSWLVAYIIAVVVALLVRVPFPQYALPVSLGVGLGNLLMSLGMTGRARYGSLLVGLYLLGSIPSYYYLPNLAALLLLFHLSLPYLAVSLWYIFEGQRAAVVILHAARGDKEDH